MRLVDADKLLSTYKKFVPKLPLPEEEEECSRRGVETCISVLKDAPTVDAVEVVHGRWVEWYPPMHMIMTGEEMLYRCSACDAKYPDVEGYRYCSRCGAMMDEP